jgi:hypothetical protein
MPLPVAAALVVAGLAVLGTVGEVTWTGEDGVGT